MWSVDLFRCGLLAEAFTMARIIVLTVLNGILAVFGSCMNIFVFVVIFTNAELQKGLNLLIVSLAASDLISCLVAQPMYMYYLTSSEHRVTFMDAFQVLSFISLHASFSNLIGITFYRMRALSRPFTHLLMVSRAEVVAVITGLWVASIIVGVLFSVHPTKLASPYCHVAMILALVATYARIFWVAKQKKKKVAAEVGSAHYSFRAASLSHENAAAQTSAILVGSSLLCFLPDVVLDLFGLAESSRLAWGYTLLFASSSLNPCVYIWRSEQFRQAYRRTFRSFEELVS